MILEICQPRLGLIPYCLVGAESDSPAKRPLSRRQSDLAQAAVMPLVTSSHSTISANGNRMMSSAVGPQDYRRSLHFAL